MRVCYSLSALQNNHLSDKNCGTSISFEKEDPSLALRMTKGLQVRLRIST